VHEVQFVLDVRNLEESADQARCAFVLPGKSSTTETPFDKSAQMCGASALFNRDEYSTNPGISMISPGNRASKNWSCTRRMASSRSANSLASVDFPAAILPHRKINFAEALMRENG
jgi:hypothetical protein